MNYDNTNKGVLFSNQKKQSEKHPDYTGNININGVEHWLSAWVNRSNNGKSYMSLSIGEPKDQQQGHKQSHQFQQDDDFSDSDLPF